MIQIHHVQISVPADCLEAAAEFYCNVMGFTNLKRPSSLDEITGLWLKMDPLQLHIRAADGVARNLLSDHVAYSVDNLDEWRQRILSQGLKVKESIPISGMDRFEFRDPFGNRVEILSLHD